MASTWIALVKWTNKDKFWVEYRHNRESYFQEKLFRHYGNTYDCFCRSQFILYKGPHWYINVWCLFYLIWEVPLTPHYTLILYDEKISSTHSRKDFAVSCTVFPPLFVICNAKHRWLLLPYHFYMRGNKLFNFEPLQCKF